MPKRRSDKNDGGVAAPPLIKGYLPVRLKVPVASSGIKVTTAGNGDDDDQQQERQDDELLFCSTYFFVKEHRQTTSSTSNCTLFVVNAPFLPEVSTRTILQSIMARFGKVERVTVIENPKQKQQQQQQHYNKNDDLLVESMQQWTNHPIPSFFHHDDDNTTLQQKGKFAHVVFRSSKEMKKAIKGLTEVMMDEEMQDGLTLEQLEIQALMDAENADNGTISIWNDDNNNNHEQQEQLSGILALTQRYRSSIAKYCHDRERLMEQCNAVIQAYEDDEEEARRAREEAASGEPDEDGFVTVVHTSSSSKRQLEQQHIKTNTKRKTKRKKNTVSGASELPDFYRFQQRSARQQSLQQLRAKFEQDLEQIKKKKEQNQYRPF